MQRAKSIENFRPWIWPISVALTGLILLRLSEEIQHLTEESYLYRGKSILSFLSHEIGVGFIVASVVWILFERVSRRREDIQWENRVKKITENVFYGVLGRNLPEDLIKTTTDLVLAQNFIREDLKIEYIISNASNEQCDYVLSTTLSFRMRNITDTTRPFDFSLRLASVMDRCSREIIKIKSGYYLFIDKKNDSNRLDLGRPIELEQINKDLQTSIIEAGSSYTFARLCSVDISPGQSVYFEVQYDVPKRGIDDEIFETFYPVDRSTVILNSYKINMDMMSVRATNKHSMRKEAESEGGNRQVFYLPHFMLPHQTLIASWKVSETQ